MPRVTFQPAGVTIEVEPGSSVLDAARQADVPLRNDCGGQGVCGRCLVQVRRGEVTRVPTRHQPGPGLDLACRTRVTGGDVEVFLPPESREVDHEVTVRTAPGQQPRPLPTGALVEKVRLDLNEPTLDDNLADAERLVRRLAAWREGDYSVPLEVLRDLPLRLREAGWKVDVTLAAETWGWRVLHVGPRTERPACILAVDVGTTALKARLLGAGSGGTASCYNSQVMYGPDVISRIIHCQRDEQSGRAAMQKLAADDVNRLAGVLLEEAGLSGDDVWAVVVSGNTTMTHFVLGLHPVWIRREPYVGCAYAPPSASAAEAGLGANPAARLYCMPSVSSFVGGDITAGILATDLGEQQEPAALIDLGTNGEIAIGCREFLVCCSASAGPAFEGAGSASGTRAREGAIDSVSGDGAVVWRTIAGAAPVGICGTGYIDLLATLLRERVLDKTGRFAPDAPDVRLEDDEPVEYVLVPGAESAAGRDIVLTRADVENLVRAKGAIYAAGSVLLGNLGMDWGDLAGIMLAGGFGERLDKGNAVTIGLLPDVPREKIEFVGNTSLKGAAMAARDAQSFFRARQIASRATYFELSTHPDFMDEFVSACFLPHTDEEKFPSVAAIAE